MTQLSLSSGAAPSATLVCSLRPSGRIAVRRSADEPGSSLPAADAQRVLDAFEQGRGHGLLHLGAREVGTALHASLAFWRSFGQSFVARVCATLDPTSPGELVVPDADVEQLRERVLAAPPMQGAELLDVALLQELWSDMGVALAAVAAGHEGGVQGYLREQSSVWRVVGRVCLHLAENKRDPEYPFAFVATYVHRVSRQAKPQHLPLGRALREYAGARNREKLLALLAPLSRAAEQSELIRELVDSGDVYYPLSWTAREAHGFLQEVSACEQAGLVVRLPDWWRRRSPPRPRVTVSVGSGEPSTFGVGALLDFDVHLTLHGERLSLEEMAALLESTEGLVLLKGRWIEVDRERLQQVLDQWRAVQQGALAGGLSFAEAMRMLAGAQLDPAGSAEADAARPEWSEVVAGDWLASRLAELRSPRLQADADDNAGLSAELRPYQRVGVRWLQTLHGLRLGGCLADDMGLGKTIQVLGLLSLLRQQGNEGTDLLIVPASLLDNWRMEFERFAPALELLVAHASRLPAADLKSLSGADVDAYDAVITSYGTAMRQAWMRTHPWRSVILDEAQAIKNPGAKQTRAIKKFNSGWRLALTGTPVENSLGDLWSIFDFLNPGLLGSAKDFGRLCRVLASPSRGYAPLRTLVQPYILRRLKTDRSVISDLPDKTEVRAWCHLSKAQAALYQQSVNELAEVIASLDGIGRRGAVLAFLMRLKQICNHPSQWLGDGSFEPALSGKMIRLCQLCESIAARQDKALVFTQFRQMTAPLATLLQEVFGAPGLVLHGGTPVRRRQGLVEQFQTDDRVPFMVLSLKAGGTGLNLTAASHVLHFDRWWNPAVENQATDRAYRIGQRRNVLVHKFVCRGTVEERIDALIESKQQLAGEILGGTAEATLTELSDADLLAMVSLDLRSALER